MKKIKAFAAVLLAALAVCALSVALTACGGGSVSDFTLSKDGKYSFTGNGSDVYLVTIYSTTDIADGAVKTGAIPRCTFTVNKNDDDKYSGTFSKTDYESADGTAVKSFVECIGGWGDVTPVLTSTTGGKVSDPVVFEKVIVGGKLATPAQNYLVTGFEIGVTPDTNLLSSYMAKEKLTSFTTEIYADSACTKKIVSQLFGENITVTTGRGTTWTGHTTSITLEGTIGVDQTVYARTKANASADGVAAESDWSEARELTLNGLIAATDLNASYYEGSTPTDAAEYTLTGLTHSESQGWGPDASTVTYEDCTATLTVGTDGKFAYVLAGKDEAGAEKKFTDYDGDVKVSANSNRQYWFTYTSSSSGGFPGGGFPGGPGGGAKTVYAGAFTSADGAQITVNFGDAAYILIKQGQNS